MNDLDFHIGQLVIANRILANEGVVDAYGHVSMRHPGHPERYLLACSRSPELVERADIKRALLEKVDASRRPGTIVSSNTSGIPIAALAEGRSDDFKRHWLGTHFFNPPRYLRLLELIPTSDTDPEVVETVARFADRRLGKGVVIARDTPNFIANRVGVFSLLATIHHAERLGIGFDTVDALTGTLIGRPKSATFRTMDIAGIDVGWRIREFLRQQGRARAAGPQRTSSGAPVAITRPYTSTEMRSASRNTASMSCSTSRMAWPGLSAFSNCSIRSVSSAPIPASGSSSNNTSGSIARHIAISSWRF